MTDTGELHEENNDQTSEDIAKNTDGGDNKEHRQVIFAQLFHKLMDGFGETCEENGVKTAIAIAIHPEHDAPVVFIRGEVTDAMALSAGVLRDFKEDLYARLNTEPR